MCTWVSACSTGDGKLWYFNARQRAAIRAHTLREPQGQNLVDDADSHSAIAAYYQLPIDQVNRYEFRPLDRHFIVDRVTVQDDSETVEKRMRRLNYRKLAPPELVWKPIVNPLDHPARKPTKREVALVRQWDSARCETYGLVWDVVKESIASEVGYSVWESVWETVSGSVWSPFGRSIEKTFRDSWGVTPKYDSIWNSVWTSVVAYAGSFFTLPPKAWQGADGVAGRGYPFQCVVTLWERGFVPTFDGKIWRLHAGPDAQIVWGGK